MKLSKLPNEVFTFTLKNDFNMTGFLLESKPDEAFEAKRVGKTEFIRTNTSSNIKLKDNIELNEDDVSRLIEAGRKVLIYYKLEKKLDAYNFDDEFKLLNVVVKY